MAYGTYGYGQAIDPVGNANKTFDFVTKALNYGEDRRRQQEKEDLALDTARLQQESARMTLDNAKTDRELADDEAYLSPVLADLKQNPANFQKYASDPKVYDILNRRGAFTAFSSKDDALEAGRASGLVSKLTEMAAAQHGQQAANGQIDTVLTYDADPQSMSAFSKAMFPAKQQGRFGVVHEYEGSNGEVTYGKVAMDASGRPIVDTIYSLPDGRLSVAFRIEETDKAGKPTGNLLDPGPATSDKTNGPDDRISVAGVGEVATFAKLRELAAATALEHGHQFAGDVSTALSRTSKTYRAKSLEKAEQQAERKQQLSALAQARPELGPVIKAMADSGLDVSTVYKVAGDEYSIKELAAAAGDELKSAIAVAKTYGGKAAKAAIQLEGRLDKVSSKSKGTEAKALYKLIELEEKSKDRVALAAARAAGTTTESGKLDDKAIDDVFKRADEARKLAAGGVRVVRDELTGSDRQTEVPPNPEAAKQAYMDAANIALSYAGSGKVSPQAFAAMVQSMPPEVQNYVRHRMTGEAPRPAPRMAASHAPAIVPKR